MNMSYFQLFVCNFRLTSIKHTKTTPHVQESKTVLDSEFHAMDSGFQSLSMELGSLVGFQLSPIPESRFPYQKLRGCVSKQQSTVSLFSVYLTNKTKDIT